MTMESGKIILTLLLYKPGSWGQKIRQLVLQKTFFYSFVQFFFTMKPEERQIYEAHNNCFKTVRRQYKEILLNLPENTTISLTFDPKFSKIKPEKWVQSRPDFENGYLRQSPRKRTPSVATPSKISIQEFTDCRIIKNCSCRLRFLFCL